MELEQLTKSQTVLLTLLVSFVTSIATGIVTVSLLDQAPPAVTQTINRVVERTIETVTPSQTQNASVITKETTVVVKEEDLITSSIEQNLTSLVTLYQGTTTNPVSGYGVIISKDGAVVADESAAVAGEGTYLVTSNGNVLYEARVAKRDSIYGLVFFVPASTATVPTVSPVKLGASQNVKLGQTVLALGSTSRANVNSGIVSSVDAAMLGEPSEKAILISASVSGKLPPAGSPLLNMFGDVIGLSTSVSRAMGDHVYVSADPIALFLKEWPENLVKKVAEDPE